METLSRKYPGFFITLEGGEGAGKSSLANHLSKYLKVKGFEVVLTREPGGSTLGETIRHWLLNNDQSMDVSAKAELLLFLAARAQHIEELIRPSLLNGKIVICDRFNDSTIAYQGGARSLDISYVKQLCSFVCGEVVPDLTFFLDVDPKIGLKRTRKTPKEHSAIGSLDRIESEAYEFHCRVREIFQQLAQEDSERIYTVDASLSHREVFLECEWQIERLLLRD